MGGKSSSSSSTSTTSKVTDQRVGADSGGIAVGAGGSFSVVDEFPDEARQAVEDAFSAISENNQDAFGLAQTVTEGVLGITGQAISSVSNTASGAGDIIGKIAERQKADEGGFQISDLIPFVGVGGGLYVLMQIFKKG